MSNQLPPALEILDGVPLVLMAARELRASQMLAGGDIVVTAPIGSVSHVRTALAELAHDVRVIEGGETADLSLHAAVDQLPNDSDSVVLIHDACRPLCPASQFDRVAIACLNNDGQPVIPVLAMTESVKVLDDGGRIVRTIPRESVVRVQTPQAVRLLALRRMHASCAADRGPEVTYFVPTGQDTQLVAGDDLSMPVISPSDRALAAVLRRRAKRSEESSAV